MAWMTMAEAAVATGVSVRTIYRRIDAEQLETRREGRHTLVNIDLPEESVADSESAGARSAPALAAGHAAAPVDSSAGGRGIDWRDLAVETLKDDVACARRSARNAWVLSAVAVLVLVFGTWRSNAVKSKYVDKYANAASKHVEEIEAMIVSYEQHLQGIQAENACVIDELNDEIARIESESAGVMSSLAENREANELLQGQLAAAGSELATVTADRDRLAGVKADLDQQVVTLNERIALQDKALAELKTQVAIYTDQRDELDGDSTELRTQLVERTEETGQLRGQVAELTSQRDELGMQAAALQQALDVEMELAGMHRGKLEALQAAHDWLADDVQELRGNLEVARAARQEIQRELEGARVTLKHVTAERDQLNEQVSGLLQTGQKKVVDHKPGSEIAKSTIDLAKPTKPADAASSEMASPQSKGAAEPEQSPRRLKITVTEPTTRPASDYRRYRLNPLRRTAFARERRW
jgi:excisionase family DNA binding protein